MKRLIIALLVALSIGLVVSGAELRISVQKEPSTINVFRARETWDWYAIGPVIEGLLSRDMDHKIIPWLAKEMPEFKPDEGKIIVHLKENVQWHDGTNFTAEDVVFTYGLIKYFDFPLLSYRLDPIDSVSKTNKYTVVFDLDMEFLEGKNSPVLYSDTLMQFIVQKKQWEPIFNEAKKQSDPLNHFWKWQPKKLIGTGAFTFEDWRKGSYVYLKSFKDYHMTGKVLNGKKLGPYIDGIMLKIYKSTDTAILALKKGEVDVVGWPLQKGYLDNIKKHDNLVVSQNRSNGYFYFAPNLRKAPWDDLAFREAINVAIDRGFIVKRILQELGKEQHSTVPEGNEFWHNPAVKTGAPASDIAKAKTILTEAGYTWQGRRLVDPEGNKVPEVVITSPPSDYDPLRFMAATMLQRWMSQLGVKAKVRPLSFAQIISKVFDQQDFDCFVLGWNLGIGPDYLRVFFSGRFDTSGGYNAMGYHSDEFDHLAKQAMLETDRTKRQELIYKLQEKIAEDLPIFPLYALTATYGRSKRFIGWHESLGGPVNGWSYLLIKGAN